MKEKMLWVTEDEINTSIIDFAEALACILYFMLNVHAIKKMILHILLKV